MSEDKPDWLRRACALEAEGRFEDAENAIRNAVPHLSFAYVIAEMYRDRMLRLNAAGDVDGARDAHRRARSWAVFYASQATSGGEGLALSVERDEFLRALGPEHGGRS